MFIMEIRKMNLLNIQGRLSRNEMKRIMAGSDATTICGLACNIDLDCKGGSTCSKCTAGKGPKGDCGCA
jgi:hypothetical protein